MFIFKSKLDYNLQLSLKKGTYNKYRVLVKCKNLFSSVLKKISSFNNALLYPIKPCNLISCQLTPKQIQSLAEYPEVEAIFFDEFLFLCGMTVSNANNYHKSSSTLKFSGKNICIGLVDSGVYPHIDLVKPNNKIDLFVDLINESLFPYDDNGHGTAMAGLICGSGVSSNNSCIGIAPLSRIASYKAFDALGKGYASTVLFAICDLVEKAKDHNIRILCLPFETLYNHDKISTAFDLAFDYALSNGVIPVLPSGSIENSQYGMMDLALSKKCLTTGGLSTLNTSNPYKYSSKTNFKKHKKPDVTAACDSITTLNTDTTYVSEKNGVKIYPRNMDVKYKTYSGTSLSVAFISAVCAILFEYDSSLKLEDIKSLLNLATSNIKEFDKDIVGNGILNLNKLLK
ncbi:S8 family serine peptidase [uncultured Clostridium sp.]|uniref:S8 family serine peptidase n=1 Tax=uncultured Clostridium sp. TaxID=59620 RepID=UPI00260EEB38|nr:S8 family serine peptidase [uncultured Clostridium sp.]